MTSYLLRRAATFLFTVWLAASMTYAALLVIPGDPARLILGIEAGPEAVAAVRAQLDLDRPSLVRYGNWLWGLVAFDLGDSFTYGLPVSRLLGERMAVTFPLAGLALLICGVLGIPLGVLAAVRRGTWADVAVSTFAQIGMATPSFWLGIFLLSAFAVRLRWLPAGGFTPWSEGVGPAMLTLLLPALALGLAKAAVLARVVRASLLETIGEDYIRTAWAKGLPPRRVIYRHGLRNALVAITTVVGVEAVQLLAGSMVVESVFSLPGLGALALGAVSNRDLPVVQGVVVLMAAVVLFVSFCLDLLYAYVDPRIRYT